jgi:hypothetical protein
VLLGVGSAVGGCQPQEIGVQVNGVALDSLGRTSERGGPCPTTRIEYDIMFRKAGEEVLDQMQ